MYSYMLVFIVREIFLKISIKASIHIWSSTSENFWYFSFISDNSYFMLIFVWYFSKILENFFNNFEIHFLSFIREFSFFYSIIYWVTCSRLFNKIEYISYGSFLSKILRV